MALNFAQVRQDLSTFRLSRALFRDSGWNAPPSKKGEVLEAEGLTFTLTQIAELAGVMVLEATAPGDTLPDAKTRRACTSKSVSVTLRTSSSSLTKPAPAALWAYAKREGARTVYRDHPFVKGQPGDLFIGKLSGIIFDVKDFDEDGNVSVLDVAGRLKTALDVERTTKSFTPSSKGSI